jgi:hypothetical protein
VIARAEQVGCRVKRRLWQGDKARPAVDNKGCQGLVRVDKEKHYICDAQTDRQDILRLIIANRIGKS